MAWLRQFTSRSLLLKELTPADFCLSATSLPGLLRLSFGEAGFRLARAGEYGISFVLLEFRPKVFIT